MAHFTPVAFVTVVTVAPGSNVTVLSLAPCQAALTLLPCSPTGGRGERWLLRLTSHRPMEQLTPAGTRPWLWWLWTPNSAAHTARRLAHRPDRRERACLPRGHKATAREALGAAVTQAGPQAEPRPTPRPPRSHLARPLALGRAHQTAAKGRPGARHSPATWLPQPGGRGEGRRAGGTEQGPHPRGPRSRFPRRPASGCG